MEEFGLLGKCHGLRVEMKRASIDGGTKNSFSVDSFREDLRSILSDNQSQSILVVSFSRAHLDQTGEGHFRSVHDKSSTQRPSFSFFSRSSALSRVVP
jgi:hypothetical protein